MQSNPEGRESERGLTRREALKRGAVLGAGVIWATPVVQSLAMSPAMAQTTSPVPGTTQPSVSNTSVGTNTTAEVEGVTIENDEVLADDLPFTGLPVEQLLPLAGGAVVTGAALVRLARERPSDPGEEETG